MALLTINQDSAALKTAPEAAVFAESTAASGRSADNAVPGDNAGDARKEREPSAKNAITSPSRSATDCITVTTRRQTAAAAGHPDLPRENDPASTGSADRFAQLSARYLVAASVRFGSDCDRPHDRHGVGYGLPSLPAAAMLSARWDERLRPQRLWPPSPKQNSCRNAPRGMRWQQSFADRL